MNATFPIILPLINAVLVFALGVLVFLKNRKSPVNIVFSLHALAITIWLFGTFMMFLNRDVKELAIFWDRFIYIGVVFIPVLLYHFSIVFCNIKIQNKILILGYILSFIFLILSRTDYFVADLFIYKWGVHTKARFFHHVFLIYFFSYVLFWFYNIYRYYRRITDPLAKQQAKYVFIAFLLLFTIGPIAYLPAYGIGIYPFAYISGVIFSVILTYAILKHHLMNIWVIATELFVGLLALILLIEVSLSKSFSEIIFRLLMFFAFGVLGWLLIKSVLNEIKRREQLEKLTAELEKTQKQLKKLDKAKSEFLSIASHQLRTPLSVIKSYISMILEKTYGEVPQAIQKPLKNIYSSNERLIKLIKTLLDISRIEAGKIELELREESLEDLISNIVAELKLEAEEKHLYLKWQKPKIPLPRILIDIGKIREAIFNLIDNAIRYTAGGGVTIKTKIQDTRYQIQVSDTGRGMTKEELSKLFKIFSRGETNTSYSTDGVGIGLYVAKKFVELHQGRIWAESAGRGKGSTFFIELPIK